MWKQPPKVASDSSADDAPIHAPSTESVEGPEAGRPRRVGVRIIRPDGSVRDVTVAGHFREEHLCSLVDDELCRIKGRESLVLHLFEPDGELIHSLRSRWQEGLSDNRRVFVREVLGPTQDPRQLSGQLEQIRQRIAAGERIDLAIRSPRVAAAARDHLRELLLISQRFDDALLNVWVHGDDDQQRRILGELETVGLVRLRDGEQFVSEQPDRRWKMPWMDSELVSRAKKARRGKRRPVSSEEAAADWIRRVDGETWG